ncbi:hypothetical protein HYV44_00135 [Candidatus Microgenomates bacterium]|nr:hypothetical protein [Candidatus Microgenomates bacterium]
MKKLVFLAIVMIVAAIITAVFGRMIAKIFGRKKARVFGFFSLLGAFFISATVASAEQGIFVKILPGVLTANADLNQLGAPFGSDADIAVTDGAACVYAKGQDGSAFILTFKEISCDGTQPQHHTVGIGWLRHDVAMEGDIILKKGRMVLLGYPGQKGHVLMVEVKPLSDSLTQEELEDHLAAFGKRLREVIKEEVATAVAPLERKIDTLQSTVETRLGQNAKASQAEKDYRAWEIRVQYAEAGCMSQVAKKRKSLRLAYGTALLLEGDEKKKVGKIVGLNEAAGALYVGDESTCKEKALEENPPPQ